MNMQDKILAIAALSGEVSEEAMARIVSSKRYRYTVAEQLQKTKLLHPYKRDKVKGYRLTAYAKQLLHESTPARYGQALEGSAHTNHAPSELSRRMRLHRISETLAMMSDTGVRLFPDEKSNLFLSTVSVIGPVPLPAFYLSKEVNELGDIAIKIKNSRMVGVLLADSGYFVVYNTASTVLRWAPASEQKLNFFLSEHFRHQLRWNKYTAVNARAIMLGEDMAMAERLFSCRGGPHNVYFTLEQCSYEHFHYLPNTPVGSTVLRILMNATATTKLTAELADAFRPKTLGDNFAYDATENTNTAVLFAWDFDMPRIRSFRDGIENRDLKGLVMAFDFQVEALARILGPDIPVRSISLEKTGRWLLETQE